MAEEDDARAHLVDLHAIAVELHLVHPPVAGGHCLGGNGAAGDDEAELGHGLRMERHSPGRATSPPGWVIAANPAMLSAMARNAPKSAPAPLCAPPLE